MRRYISNLDFRRCNYADYFLKRHKTVYESVIENVDKEEEELHTSGSDRPEPKFPAKGSRIKVAILDTGLDVSHIYVKACEKRIKDIRSWVNGLNGKQDRNAGDASGHGTHITCLLLDVAPDTDVYVARIAEHHPESPDQIAKAIMYAVTEWEVDIISMSFGLTDETEPGCKDFLTAIETARSRKVLMLAAASNHGSHGIPAFPARHSSVFCIFAADGMGNRGPANPTARIHAHNFSTLGLAVESAWPRALGRELLKRKSGTSFAVPVAAGIVATILLYVRQKLSGEEARRLKEFDKMRDMLCELSSSRDGYNVISFGDVFRDSWYVGCIVRRILAGGR
ncbi:peptidase S8/S53 domain-containing protein [Corynascus similis CBS 632.67]